MIILINKHRNIPHIRHIFITPKERGNGYSKLLWNYFKEHSNIIKKTTISIEAKEDQVRIGKLEKLYKSWGFETVNERYGYIDGCEDCFKFINMIYNPEKIEKH
jgi:predicted GNAT family N-acyltransferase